MVVEVFRGVTSPVFLKKPLTHPYEKTTHPAGTVFVRKNISGKPSAAPPTTRSDWQTVLHLWEVNRGVTLQGQIILQFTLLVNNWNPFEPGGNTGFTIHQAECLAGAATPLGRPQLSERLFEIIKTMKPIGIQANHGMEQHFQGGEYKKPVAEMIRKLCEDFGLSPPI